MPSLLDPISDSAKILYLGDSGHGKTGSKAALLAAGYKLRMIDTDRGFKILRSLLTDSHYPYAAYIKKHGIDLNEPGRISYIPIDLPIDFQNVAIKSQGRTINTYTVLAPTNARAWSTVISLLKEWKDGEHNFGAITDWDTDVVLDFDTIATLAELAKYWIQELNNRLGALEDDHGRDIGDAQELISRLMVKLTSPSVRCNVICTTHVKMIDTQRGAALSPAMLLREKKATDPRGFPAVIGNALSPFLPKRWNDSFIAQRIGEGNDLDYRIYTVPRNNTDAKNSVWLEPSYPISTGLAEIFAALQYKSLPEDFIPSLRNPPPTAEHGSASVARAAYGSRS